MLAHLVVMLRRCTIMIASGTFLVEPNICRREELDSLNSYKCLSTPNTIYLTPSVNLSPDVSYFLFHLHFNSLILTCTSKSATAHCRIPKQLTRLLTMNCLTTISIPWCKTSISPFMCTFSRHCPQKPQSFFRKAMRSCSTVLCHVLCPLHILHINCLLLPHCYVIPAVMVTTISL